MSSDFTPLACSAESRTTGESIFASVKPTRYWFMLEFDSPWGAKALPDSSLPEAVKEHLNQSASKLQSSRVLLIRQQPRQVSGGHRLFLAVADEKAPALFEFELDNYRDLLDLDLAAINVDARRFAGQRRHAPLFLVCTNGRRDPCCAAYGLPVYTSLAETNDPAIWQTSHVGGHRFAANMACMPHGLFYGRVDPDSAPVLIEAYRQQQLLPERYRGRACYTKIVQAAEYFLRREQQLLALDQIHFLETNPAGENEHLVRFQVAGLDQPLNVRIKVDPQGYRVLSSCQDDQPGFAPSYRLLEIN